MSVDEKSPLLCVANHNNSDVIKNIEVESLIKENHILSHVDEEEEGEVSHQSKTRQIAKRIASKFTPQALYLTFLVVALFISGTVNGVVSKRMFDAYTDNGAYFASQGNNFNYLILAGGVLIYKFCFTSDITPEMRKFQHYKFGIMAFADGLGSFLAAIGAPYCPGQYQTLLNQTLIPVTMIIAFFILGTRYKIGEITGATIVLGGALLAVIPSIFNQDHQVGSFKWQSSLIYFASNIPMAYSSVYKELGFQDTVLDCYFLTFWVSLYQFIIGFAFAPIQGLPGFGGIPMKQIPGQFWDGCKCFAGYNPSPDWDCRYTALWLVGYSVINFIYNVFGLILTKEGSKVGLGAVFCTIAYAIKVPLSNLAFTIPAIMGSDVEKFTIYSLTGLFVVLLGFCIFFISNQRSSQVSPNVLAEEERKLLEAVESENTTDVEEEVESSLLCGLPTPINPACPNPACNETSVWGFHDRVVGIASANVLHHHLDCPYQDKNLD